MIIRERDYIKKQKQKYLKWGAVWTALVLAVYGTGILMFGSVKSYFTVFAGVLVIGAALDFTRYVGYAKFKDCKEEMAKPLEQMKGSFDLFHSTIIPDNRGTAYFEHIVVTSKSIYIITYDEQKIKKQRLWMENKLNNKGIPMEHVHVVAVKTPVDMKNLAGRIEKDACFTSQTQEEYTKIINEMLM